jgi:hypothetical protein
VTHDAIILPDGKASAKNDMQELFVQNNQREKQSNVGPDTQLIITNDMAATTLLAGMNTSKRAVMGTNKALQASLFNELGKRSHELVFRHG